MADKFWKAVERRIAKLFGTERIGAKNGNCQPDFINDWLVGEVVCHAVPKWIRAEHKQALDRAVLLVDRDRLPILVIHEKNGSNDDDLVVLKLTDFVDWFGSVAPLRNSIDNRFEGSRLDIGKMRHSQKCERVTHPNSLHPCNCKEEI